MAQEYKKGEIPERISPFFLMGLSNYRDFEISKI